MLKNMVDANTLIVTTGPPNGGSSFCSLNCTNVQRIPPQIAADKQRQNPTVSNSTSPNAVNISPAVMSTPTMIKLRVIFSKPKVNALSNTQIGADDLTIVKNVIDIRTKDMLDKPTSNAVTSPHGTEIPVQKYV